MIQAADSKGPDQTARMHMPEDTFLHGATHRIYVYKLSLIGPSNRTSVLVAQATHYIQHILRVFAWMKFGD